MARNVEIKARVKDLAALEAHVRTLASTGPEHLVQTDTFFHALHGRLKLREFADGSAELIAYERGDQTGPKLSSYERAPVSQPAALIRALARSNGVSTQVRKHRTVYLIGQTRVHLDRVENLGDFAELEVVLQESQSLEDGEHIAHALLRSLQIDASQRSCLKALTQICSHRKIHLNQSHHDQTSPAFRFRQNRCFGICA